MAKAMRDKGVAIEIIAETSGLSKEEIEKLQIPCLWCVSIRNCKRIHSSFIEYQ